MNLRQVLPRLCLLSFAAAAFAVLTAVYGHTTQTRVPPPRWRAERLHRPSAPDATRFPEVLADGAVVAICTVAGRLVFRLRLSPTRAGDEQPTLLGLPRQAKELKPIND